MEEPADQFGSILHKSIGTIMRQSMRSFFLYAKESRFSMSQVGALFQIHRLGICGVTDLGDHLGITRAAASQMLNRLVQHGLILRSEDPDDRRAKQLALTDKGREVLEEGFQSHQLWLRDLANSLSTDEKQQVTAALNILVEKVNQLAPITKP